VLLVAPGGQQVVLMSDAGGSTPLTGVNLTFDDGASPVPQYLRMVSGTYQPSDYAQANFFPPAPAGFGGTLADLASSTPNGKWKLYVQDNAVLNFGSLTSWTLNLIPTPVITPPYTSVTLFENGPSTNLYFTVQDSSPWAQFILSGTGDAMSIVSASVSFSTSGTNEMLELTLTPKQNQYGTNLPLILSISDGLATGTATIIVTVQQVNQPPQLVTTLPDFSTPAGDVSPGSAFTAWDPQDKPLTVTAISSDTKLIPNNGISISGGTKVGTTNSHDIFQYLVTVLPSLNLTGKCTITLTIADSVGQTVSDSFDVTVLPSPPPPQVNPIVIPEGYPLVSNANPYPSKFTVSGLNGFVTDVQVTLLGFTHLYPADVDVLLVSPDGNKSAILMAHAGGSTAVNGLRLTFQDGANPLPYGTGLSSGRYAPSSYAPALSFASDAPGSGYTTNLASFFGTSPNGDWKLYVMDDSYPLGGSIDGWTLSLKVTPTNSPPRLSVRVDNGQLTITFSGAANAAYGLQCNSDLSTWTEVTTVTADDTGKAEYTGPVSIRAKMFYRAVVK